jgi:hypothetical protein
MSKREKWEVVDHTGDVSYSADLIASEPVVASGYMTPRRYAEWLAKTASDPEAPGPLVARKAV